MFTINDIPVTVERFPDETPRLIISVDSPEVMLEWIYEKDEEMILYFIARHLREKYGIKKLTLKMPYIPHARMDRVKERPEVFTLKYFCDFINSLAFDKVMVRDPHSYVSLGLLNNVEPEPVDGIIRKLADRLLDTEQDIIFFPDEGSCKRYAEKIAFPCAFGIKTRDWSTGRILGLTFQGKQPEKSGFKVLMIDDISSFGGTFYHAATKWKDLGAGQIYLYVTHCENTILKGELIKSGLLDKIYTTHSIFTEVHPLIEVLEF